MSCCRHAGPLLIGLGTAMILGAQQEVRVSSWNYVPAAPALQVETKLVDVGVVVRDRQGRAIAGLTKDDFKIFDDNKERAITAFSVDTSKGALTEAPRLEGAAARPGEVAAKSPEPARPVRYLALVFDDVHIKNADLMHVRVAAKRFVNGALQPGDRVGIFTTSAGKVADFTSDVAKLLEVIETLSAHLRMSENGLMPCPRITPYQAYLIVNQDPAALQAAVDSAHNCSGESGGMATELRPFNDPMLRTVRVQAEQTWDQARTISQSTLDAIERILEQLVEMPGNRVLLLASSGFLAESLEYEQNRIIDRALRTGVVINALDAKGLYGESVVLPADESQQQVALPIRTIVFEASRKGQELQTGIAPIAYMAQSTGGLFFHDSNDLTRGLQQLGAVPEVTYRLGFRPDDESDKRYHKLKVKLETNASYIVQARPGYVAALVAAAPREENLQKRLDRELMGADTLANVPVGVTVEPGKSLVWLLVHVDLKQLQFAKQSDRQAQRIVFLTGLLDEKGNVVAAKEGRMDLDLTQPTFARLSESGINAKLSLEAPAGTYRLRAIVEEGVEGKLSASTQAVKIH